MVVKLKNLVNMEKRKYHGRLSYSDVSNYLSLFASKNETDRTQMEDIGKTRIRDQILKNGSKITVEEIDYTNFKSNFDHPDDIIILHVTDTFSMNYPNLFTFQTFFGNLTRFLEAKGNTLNKKRIMKRVLPNEHIPYIIVYPRGDLKHKMKNKKVLGANHTIEDLLETVSQMLPDTVESVPNEQLETRIVQSLFDGKLSLVLFHDENEISMGLRRLALSPYYRKYFDFFQVRDPPKDRMKQLGIPKLNKLILFMANPILLSDPESDAPIDKISYELPFIIDHLKMFLDDMINDHGKYLQKIPEIKTQKDLDSIFSSSSKRYYLLFIIDKSLEVRNDQLIDREHDMLIINKHGGENVTSAYIDFSCHPYLANKFRFEDKQVPLLVIYDAMNKSFYRSEFRLNIYDGRNLVSKVIQEGQFKDRFRPAVLEIGYSKCNEEEQAIEDVDL